VTPDRTPERTIDLDNAPEPGTRGRPDWRRLLRPSMRQTTTTAALTAIAALLVGYAIGAGPLAPSHPPAVAAPLAAVSDQQQGRPARLLVPATADAGERVPVLAFRNPKLCGPAELRFDGTAVEQQIIPYAARDSYTHPQIFMSMDVPRSAKPGIHEIELLGPVPTTHGTICADIPERQGRIASTTIWIDAR
jgi:hypothetical protein